MELVAIKGLATKRNERLFEEAYRLRHRVFVEQKQWEALRRPDGREIDQFDTEDAINIFGVENSKVVGYSRLLPTTKPNLLSEVYPWLAYRPIPSSPSIYEWTRYCVEPEKRGERAIDSLGSALLYGVMAYAFNEGIEALSMQTEPNWVIRMGSFGFGVDALGIPQPIDGEDVIALTVTLSERGLAKCRRMLRVGTTSTRQPNANAPARETVLN